MAVLVWEKRAVVFYILTCLSAFAFLSVAADESGRPGGSLFGLLLVIVVCFAAGEISNKVFRVPALVGMLVAGIALRNLHAIDGLPNKWMSVLKGTAEGIIMLRAGMGLDLGVLRKSGVLLASLSIIPGLVEASIAAGVAYGMFRSYDLDIKWGFMLGFVLSDVSPAVTVPLLLDFILKGYSKKAGIPTVLLAASGFNGVISITCFGVMMNIVFATDRATWVTVFLGIAEIIGGLLVGCVVGYLIVQGWDWSPDNSDYWRFGMMLLQSIIGIFLGKYLKMSGGGTLAVIMTGIVMKALLKDKMKNAEAIFAQFWNSVGQTLLFGLLGAQVNLDQLTPKMCSSAVVVILVALVFRFVTTMACVANAKGWSFLEKLFAGVAWCPKATVQAALSTVALDYVTENDGQFDTPEELAKNKTLANIILTAAVLSIIMTAPIFGALMSWAGHAWLEKDEEAAAAVPVHDLEDELSSKE